MFAWIRSRKAEVPPAADPESVSARTPAAVPDDDEKGVQLDTESSKQSATEEKVDTSVSLQDIRAGSSAPPPDRVEEGSNHFKFERQQRPLDDAEASKPTGKASQSTERGSDSESPPVTSNADTPASPQTADWTVQVPLPPWHSSSTTSNRYSMQQFVSTAYRLCSLPSRVSLVRTRSFSSKFCAGNSHRASFTATDGFGWISRLSSKASTHAANSDQPPGQNRSKYLRHCHSRSLQLQFTHRRALRRPSSRPRRRVAHAGSATPGETERWALSQSPLGVLVPRGHW